MQNHLSDIQEIKNIIQQTISQTVREAIKKEMMKIRLDLIKYVDDEEQKEIENTYGAPENDIAEKWELNL